MRPRLGLLGERPEVPLSAPVVAGSADPAVKNLPVVELDAFAEPVDEVGELRLALVAPKLVHHLEGHRNDRAERVVRQRRLRHQDEKLTVPEPLDYLLGRFLPRELPEILLDVLDFERASIERVLLDQVLHWMGTGLRTRIMLSSGPYQQKVMRLHQAFDRDFRAVPSERPALHFEGTLHESTHMSSGVGSIRGQG